jgi:hypothetical protein
VLIAFFLFGICMPYLGKKSNAQSSDFSRISAARGCPEIETLLIKHASVVGKVATRESENHQKRAQGNWAQYENGGGKRGCRGFF